MRLLLIRHGQTPANVAGELDTDAPGPGLTELGVAQAEALPDALAAERLDGIFVSRLRRTHRTAEPLARSTGLTPLELPGIHEIEAGDLEGRADDEAVSRYMSTAWAWGSGDLDPRMPGAEDGHDFYRRFDADLAHIAASQASDATVAVFSHGAAIRVWTAGRATNIQPEFPGRQHLDNTGVVALVGSPSEGWILTSFGGQPVGGAALHDVAARDVTGE